MISENAVLKHSSRAAAGSPQFCDACFSGDYPIEPSDARADGRIKETVGA